MSLHKQPQNTPTKITSFDHRQVRDMGHTKALEDAAIYGSGFMLDGKHIPLDDVYIMSHTKAREELERMFELWCRERQLHPDDGISIWEYNQQHIEELQRRHDYTRAALLDLRDDFQHGAEVQKRINYILDKAEERV